ncbi:DUF3618 domain-containing protein [Antrihabitans sp. YC2-6]|uniref:DUF3618 domain-containing protein n=1 Tax=Antrihabitans sp. YC2-6 TaxID=2799498 RepID=UPI0018F43F0D|nr:DUF3618 domain-containing protein [Antrihabitans sp. YC2-6]MBJ8346631.1 DUF3618 domain-containing protein [Antrihabitans sp. YC2-6]
MSKDTERIEREIEAARNQLAATLDELSVRANPKRIADNAKASVVAKVNEPAVKYSLIGAALLFVLLLLVKIFR